jgi:hypothetical protein
MFSRAPSYLLLTLALFAAPLTTAWADDLAAQAEQLSALRTEVETLAEELDLERDALRSELRSYELKRTELEARVRQEERRLEELETLAEEHRELLEGGDVVAEVLVPVLLKALDDVQASIEAGLPYRMTDRLDAVHSLRATLQDGSLEPRRGASRVWQLIEDELRLSRETVVDRQVITLRGAETLVKVARVGMIAMYFLTEDGKVGLARRDDTGWRYEQVDGAEETEVLDLFDAMAKQVRVGWFDLPMPLPEVSQ